MLPMGHRKVTSAGREAQGSEVTKQTGRWGRPCSCSRTVHESRQPQVRSSPRRCAPFLYKPISKQKDSLKNSSHQMSTKGGKCSH